MPTTRSPRKGSLQFWPRKVADRIRLRTKAKAERGLVGFAGYKVGMVHAMVIDNRAGSLTKGSTISMPLTVIECPALRVFGINFYKKTTHGLALSSTFVSTKNTKELSRLVSIPKNTKKKLDDYKAEDYEDIRLMVYTQPKTAGFGKKRPEMFELGLGGKINDQLAFAKENLGKELKVMDVLKPGQLVDAHCLTKAKGFQGPVKRFGVAVRKHKSEKTKRGPGSLGPWCGQGHIMWRVAHAGRMGHHQRTEYNKWVIKIGEKLEEINPKSGFLNYGVVKNPYLLVCGSVGGPRKSLVIFTNSIRPRKNIPKEAPVIKTVVKE
jgi:large subunit ribosomal protein L3